MTPVAWGREPLPLGNSNESTESKRNDKNRD